MSKVIAGMTLLLAVGAANWSSAQELPVDLRAQVASFQQATNGGRLTVLQKLLLANGLEFEVQAFTGDAGTTSEVGQNVVVTLGTGAAVGVRDIVLGAHYDAETLQDGSITPGAVDNAAAVVALVQAVAALRSHSLSHRLRVVFFDQEELGLVGSKHYAASAGPAGIAAMVNLDVTAYGDTIFFRDKPDAMNAGIYAALRDVCASGSRNCVGFANYPSSDYLSFEKAGVPSVSLGVLPRAEAYQLWLLLNARAESQLQEEFKPRLFEIIHTSQDTVEKVEPATIELTAALLVDLVLQLDRTLR